MKGMGQGRATSRERPPGSGGGGGSLQTWVSFLVGVTSPRRVWRISFSPVTGAGDGGAGTVLGLFGGSWLPLPQPHATLPPPTKELWQLIGTCLCSPSPWQQRLPSLLVWPQADSSPWGSGSPAPLPFLAHWRPCHYQYPWHH